VGYRVNAVLLDTHVVLWWLEGGSRVSRRARTLIEDSAVKVFVSAASFWEIAIKYKAGKLDAAASLVSRFANEMEDNRFTELPVSIRHAIVAGLLETKHKDPFDRMLIAQARVEKLTILSTDSRFDEYDVPRLW
jgi:PIN domain nuclease of toxin-antitoxin system